MLPPAPKSFSINFGVLYAFFPPAFTSLLPRIASTGAILEARIAVKMVEKKMVSAENTTAIVMPGKEMQNAIRLPLSPSCSRALHITVSRAVTPIPKPTPSGTPMAPSTKPSKSTLRRICRGVAPTELSMPYSRVFSVMEIAKLLRMMKMLDRMIIVMTTIAMPIRMFIVCSLTAKVRKRRRE